MATAIESLGGRSDRQMRQSNKVLYWRLPLAPIIAHFPTEKGPARWILTGLRRVGRRGASTEAGEIDCNWGSLEMGFHQDVTL